MRIKIKHRAGQIFIKGDIFFTRSQTKEKEQANNFPINSKWCITTTALDYFSSCFLLFLSIMIEVISPTAIPLIILLHLWQLNYNFTYN